MATINSLQGQVIDQDGQPMSQALVEIRCEGGIASFYKTDSQGYFIDNGIRDAVIDQIEENYQLKVNHVAPAVYTPKPPLQRKDAEISTDQNGNKIFRFPLKIIA
ncbi:MAG TPA: carboxypeptidase-like regulatory domain-containing protein [Bacteroidota bacterium]|nr:carboxypeptidase-like regulatory domain-containing protein [Bacteroidota bacterium]